MKKKAVSGMMLTLLLTSMLALLFAPIPKATAVELSASGEEREGELGGQIVEPLGPETSTVVMFETSHDQFTSDFPGWISDLQTAGYVVTTDDGDLNKIGKADILIIPGARGNYHIIGAYTDAEAKIIASYVNSGGNLILLSDWGPSYTVDTIEIAEELGVTLNKVNKGWTTFTTSNFDTSHPIMSGISKIKFFAHTTIASGGNSLIWTNLGEDVAVTLTYGQGHAVIFTDYNWPAKFVNGYNTYDNAKLAMQTVGWLEICARPNQPPVANFTYFPTEPKAGEQISFDPSPSYDPDGEIISYEWDWDYDGVFDVYTECPIPITFWWIEEGDYEVGLKVTDNNGAVSILYKYVTIRKSPTGDANAILAGWFDWLHWWWWKNHKHFVTIDGWLREFEPESKPLDWLKGTKFAWCEEADVVYIFDKDIDPAQAPGLTYKIHALNTIYEEELVHEAFRLITPTYEILKRPVKTFLVGSVQGLPIEISEQAILDLAPELGIGVSTILLALKVHGIISIFKEIDKVIYRLALGTYFRCRLLGEWGGPAFAIYRDPEVAWNEVAPLVETIDACIWASEEERKEILQATKWYFEELWLKYKGLLQTGDVSLYLGFSREFLENNKNQLKNLLLSGLEKYKKELPNKKRAKVASPGQLRVYDSQGRVTGLVDGEIREDIPNSVYDDETKTVKIFFPSDSYRYEVVGTEEGTYGLEITSVEDGEATTFTAADIPTTSGTIHQYTIDWDAVSLGEEGVTVQMDSDGDGTFEQTIVADNELSHNEFVREYLCMYTQVDKTFKPNEVSQRRRGSVMSWTYINNTGYLSLSEITFNDTILDGWTTKDLDRTVSVTLFIDGVKYQIPYDALDYVAIEDDKYIVYINFTAGVDLYQFNATSGMEEYRMTIYAFEPGWVLTIKYPMHPPTDLLAGDYEATVSVTVVSPEDITVTVEDTATLHVK